MNVTQALKQEITSFINEMNSAKISDDDDFIAFSERYEAFRERLSKSKLESEDSRALSDAMSAAFQRLSNQLSFCTLH